MHKKKKLMDDEIKEMILKMNKQGKSVDKIDEKLVYGVGLSPEYSWKLIKSTLGLKVK